jgi:hypothetical protein
MKNFLYYVTVFSLLLTTGSGFTQYDQYKPRTIIHYDNIVNIPKPVNDTTGSWWNFFIIGAGVMNYMGSVDSSRDCLILFDQAYFQSDSMSSSIGIDSVTINAPPSDSIPGPIDYIIYGQVDGSNGNYTYTLNLEVRKTREVVKSVQVLFSDGFNPIQIGSQAASQLGPVIYNTMMDFEKEKRDQDEAGLRIVNSKTGKNPLHAAGAKIESTVLPKIQYTYPHAVSPIVLIQPAKTEVKPGETIGVIVVAIDNGSHPLKGRTITLEAVNGTLKATSLTTDAGGGAATEFTAAGVSGLATISGVLEYMTGTEYKGKADCQPAVINIDRPNDTYVVHATYSKYSIDHPGYDLLITGSFTRSTNYNWTTIYIDAWVKNVAGPYEIFRSSDPIIEQCKADEHIIKDEREYNNFLLGISDTKTWEIQDGKYSEEGYYLMLTVDDIGYNWNISQIPLNLTTSGTVSTTITYHPDPLGQSSSKVTSNNSNGSTTTSITTMGGAKRDTSYTKITTTTDILGGTDRSTKTLKKTFALNDSSGYTTTWSNHYTTSVELPNTKFGSITHLSDDVVEKATVTLQNTNPSNAVSNSQPVVRSFSLQQNYPNPFNPSTMISFSIPSKGFVSLKVFDLLGREVVIIISEEMSAGNHTQQWNAKDLSSGVYFYRLQAGSFSETKKLVLLR